MRLKVFYLFRYLLLRHSASQRSFELILLIISEESFIVLQHALTFLRLKKRQFVKFWLLLLDDNFACIELSLL